MYSAQWAGLNQPCGRPRESLVHFSSVTTNRVLSWDRAASRTLDISRVGTFAHRLVPDGEFRDGTRRERSHYARHDVTHFTDKNVPVGVAFNMRGFRELFPSRDATSKRVECYNRPNERR
jgi:hypothetical protein